MTDIAQLGFDVDSRPLRQGSTDLDRFGRAGVETGNRVSGAARTATRAFAGLAAAVGAVGVVRSALSASDSYTQMSNSLRVLGLSSVEVSTRLDEIAGVAQRTRAPLEATANLYQRVSIASAELGASQSDVLRFTETVNLALAQTGAPASQAAGALTQLGQALAGGVVRAEEFNSILENGFPIAQAAARGIEEAGGSVGRLRQLMLDGQISSEDFFNAILSQSDSLEAAFAGTVPTVSQAVTKLGDSLTLLVGGIDASFGASAALARGIMGVSNSMTELAQGAFDLTGSMETLGGALLVIGATRIPAVVTGIYSMVTAMSVATVATRGFAVAASAMTGTLALLGGPVGIAAAAATAIGLYALSTRDAEQPAYDAATGTSALLGVLDDLHANVAPAAATEVIELAESNHVLAASAFEAAKAELAKTQALLAAARANNNLRGRNLRGRELALNRRIQDQIEALTAAEAALAEAIRNRKVAANTVVGAMSELMTQNQDAAARTKELTIDVKASASGMSSAANAATDLSDGLDREVSPAIAGVSSAFGDFVSRGLRDFDGFKDSILSQFENMLARMVATAAANQITIGLGLGATGLNLLGGGAASAGGGIGINPLSLVSTGANALDGGGGGLLSGLSGILGGGGLGSSFSNLGGLLTGSVGGLGAIGAAIPAAGLVAAVAVPLVNSFLGSSKITGRDLDITATRGAVDVDNIRTKETKRFFGLSRSRSIRVRDNVVLTDALTREFGKIQDQIETTAGVLGVGERAFDDFTYRTRLSIKGLSREDIQQKVTEEVTRMTESYAALIPGLSSVSRRGETLTQTLAILESSLGTVNSAFETLGLKQFASSLSGAQNSRVLLDRIGGTNAFDQATNSFFTQFYSQDEQLRLRRTDITKDARALGFRDLPSRNDLRSAVENAAEKGYTRRLADLLSFSPVLGNFLDAQDAYDQSQKQIADERKRAREQAEAAVQRAREQAAGAARRAQEQADEDARRAREQAGAAAQRAQEDARRAEEQAARDAQQAKDERRRDIESRSSLFRTLADREFAATETNLRTMEQIEVLKESQKLLAQIVKTVREGDINTAITLNKLLKIQRRDDLEGNVT